MPASKPEPPDELIEQLLALIDSLHAETRGFLDDPGDQQVWYNRGYANGMLSALKRLGLGDRLGGRLVDADDALAAHLAMPWGRAYRHGEAMGRRETHEITGTPVS